MKYEGEERRKNLNGDVKVIADLFLSAFNKLETKVDETTKAIGALDCKAHAEVLKQFKDHVRDGRTWRGVLVGVILSLFGFAIAWGGLKTDVNHLNRAVEKLEKFHEPRAR
ncbi:hypothetical protein [Sulfuricurvum sp.]|uniref:hypothetical protein n=1 Tax=Sulfuricurvum sp. TaxID=2025608 RepID=UPI0035666A34